MPAPHGWGVAMSTDTALALGLLVMVGRDVPDRVRMFLLTVFVVDDLVALLVIAVVYSDHIDVGCLLLAVALFGAAAGGQRSGACGAGSVYFAIGRGDLGQRCWPAASTRSSPAWRSG